MKKGLIIFFILIFSFITLKASAQIQSGDILLEINPSYPKINERVSASLSSFTTDLNTARISWKLDDKTTLEGVGKKDLSFIFDSNTSKRIDVKIETISGSVINRSIVINTSNVDILWEAYNTYTPPFYRGKSLMPVEGMTKVIAIPNINNITGSSYNWALDYKNKPSSSGYEKDSFLYQNSYLEKNNTIEVFVSDIFGNNIGSNKITITPTKPKILFYERNPLFGTKWEKSLSSGFKIKEDGAIIVAEPYFFSGKDFSSNIFKLTWFLNNDEIPTTKQENFLSIKPETGGSGSSTIKISINNLKTLFQSVEKQLNVNF